MWHNIDNRILRDNNVVAFTASVNHKMWSAEANAAYIIQACNAYPQLIESLRWAMLHIMPDRTESKEEFTRNFKLAMAALAQEVSK